MVRISMKSLFLTAVLLLALSSLASAADRLRPITSVYFDNKGGSLKFPEGVAGNDKGTIVVADTANGRLLRYTFKDGAVKGGDELKPSQLTYPIRLQLGSKGDIWALDGKQRRIVHLNADGGFVGYVDPQGVPAPAPVVPRSFKLDGKDGIYLLDIYGARVLVLDPSGKFQRQIAFPKDYGFFSDLAVNGNGDILLLDSVNATVFVSRKDAPDFVPLSKNLQEYVSFPTYLTTTGGGMIDLVDQNGGTIAVLGGDGGFRGRMLSLGWKEGQLYYPGQIGFAGAGTVVIADRNNSRVQVFELIH